MNSNQNISAIETFLHGLFKSVSENTFVGRLPETIKNGWTDMVLIDCDNGVYDYDAYGSGTVLLFLYAKPMAGGQKNVKKLKEMENAVNAIIESSGSTNDYYIYRRRTYSDYDYSRNWHCNVVLIGITAK